MLTLETDIETVNYLAIFFLLYGNQRIPMRRVFDAQQDRIARVGGFIFKIYPGEGVREHPARKYDDIDVRRLYGIPRPGNRTRLNGIKPIIPAAIRGCPAMASKTDPWIRIRSPSVDSEVRTLVNT